VDGERSDAELLIKSMKGRIEKRIRTQPAWKEDREKEILLGRAMRLLAVYIDAAVCSCAGGSDVEDPRWPLTL
jgi:hypothetical protein